MEFRDLGSLPRSFPGFGALVFGAFSEKNWCLNDQVQFNSVALNSIVMYDHGVPGFYCFYAQLVLGTYSRSKVQKHLCESMS